MSWSIVMVKVSPSLATSALRGTAWAYFSAYGGKILAFVTTTILARILLKEDFGLAGYALVVIGFLETINGLGIGSALIFFPFQQERSDTAFWLGLGIGFLLFAFTWLITPFIADFFHDERVMPITRALALAYPISALGIVHEAILMKELAFRLKTIPDFMRTIGKGIVSIILALLGYGAWSLIVGQLAGVAFSVIAFWMVVSWRPGFQVSKEHLKPLTTFGSNIVFVNIFGIILLNADYVLVGHYLGAVALGVYTLAFRVPNLLVGQFAGVLGQVLFPTYSSMEEDRELIRKGLYLTLKYVSLVTVPLGVGLALISKPFVLIFFTTKWIDAVPVISLLSLAAVVDSLSYNFGDVYKAQGRPDILTKLSFFRALILLPALYWAVSVPANLIVVSIVVLTVSAIGTIAQILVAKFVINISFRRMLGGFLPALTSVFVMSLVVLLSLRLSSGLLPWLQLTVAVLLGAATYLGALWLLYREDVLNVSLILKKGFKKS